MVTVIVPAALTVNDRLLVPPGASTLDQFSLVVVVGVEGVVGVLFPPHAEPTNMDATMHANTGHGVIEAQRPVALRVAVSLRPVSVVVVLMGA